MKETKAKFIFRPFNKIDTAIVDFFKNHDKYKGKDLKDLTLDYFQKRIRFRFKGSKFKEDNYDTDKENIISKYNELGYRDAYIVKDTFYLDQNKDLNIEIYIEEGKNITLEISLG